MTQLYVLPKPSDLPAFEAAQAELGRVPEILYRGLEFGAYKTSAYRDIEFPGKRLDAGLSATMLRAHAIDFFRREGLDAQEDGCRWHFNRLPFLGISFYFNQFHIRILKGPEGQMPGCGDSKRKKGFYNQKQSYYLDGNITMQTKANLIVLWDFAAGYTLNHLWLVLPARGGARPEDVSAYWCEPLTHPAEQSASTTAPIVSTDDGLDDMIKPRTEFVGEENEGNAGAR